MLYFGDSLDILRGKIKDESIDQVYLDPPFNSSANYNVLFRAPSGEASEAQAGAFRDTWEWGESARDAFEDVIAANGDVALVLSGLRKWLGENAMMAYIVMMAARLIELRRVMKPKASLYLHCDPTARHYLKLILDSIFGHENFRNEIVWKRSGRSNFDHRGSG
jgi:adenine specific DNA methylase Mod